MEDISHDRKLIGSQKPNHIINLVLLDKHYFLNENVEGINKYYLDHYDEINEACKNKSNEWKMKVYTMKNRKGKQVYEINNKKAHMKSWIHHKMAPIPKCRQRNIPKCRHHTISQNVAPL